VAEREHRAQGVSSAGGRQRQLLLAMQRRYGLKGAIYFHTGAAGAPRDGAWLVHTLDAPLDQRLKEHLRMLEALASRARCCVVPRVLCECEEGRGLLEALGLAALCGTVLPLHGPQGSFAIAVALHRDRVIPRHHIAPLHHVLMRHFERCLTQGFRRSIDLSRREQECLHWCACGKSYWETSVILGISERTVHHHMNMVRKKLGVQSNAQAVARATVMGLLEDPGMLAAASGR